MPHDPQPNATMDLRMAAQSQTRSQSMREVLKYHNGLAWDCAARCGSRACTSQDARGTLPWARRRPSRIPTVATHAHTKCPGPHTPATTTAETITKDPPHTNNDRVVVWKTTPNDTRRRRGYEPLLPAPQILGVVGVVVQGRPWLGALCDTDPVLLCEGVLLGEVCRQVGEVDAA